MRLTRVYVRDPLLFGSELLLAKGAAQHLVRVLRLATGSALTLFNGEGGEAEANITAIQGGKVTVRVGGVLNVERESPLNVTLLQGIARGDKMDTIVQKATQLGVTRITPLLLQRSNVRLDAEVSKRKQAHWQGVLESACEQCGRNRLPLLTPPTSLQSALAELTDGLKLLLAPRDDSPSLSSLVGSRDLGAPIYLLVGPEGGLDPNEIEAAVAAGFVECRLGPRILRTETAALAALAALQALAGDYQ